MLSSYQAICGNRSSGESVMKSSILVMACIFAAGAAVAQDQPGAAAATLASASKGQMVVAANGARLGTVYRLTADGSPQVIIDGRMVTIPATTLSVSDGKLMTSLSKSAVSAIH
jgi:hypothetical protein